MSDTAVLFFSQKEYPFSQGPDSTQTILPVAEPAGLWEQAKKGKFPIILFDSAHPQTNKALVWRIYRQTPESEFWLLSDNGLFDLPDDIIDQTISTAIAPEEFAAQVASSLKMKVLLEKYRLVGKSGNLKRAAEMVAQVAPTVIATLIIGPSGSGKEVIAHAVHEASPRKNRPFIAVNCGALTETLLESELFGHERGAFTGAVSRREGIFKRADGGTVFLDEIGETSPALQVKLLRALEEGTFYRVGGEEPVRTDIRVVAATNRELTEAIGEGKFREDLYFRLSAFRINLTGLSDRRTDILPLINHFFVEQTGAVRPMSERAAELLLNYSWPGNVRQVKNFVNRISLAAGKGEISEQAVMQFIEEQGFSQRNLPVVTGQTPRQAEFQLIYQALLSLGQEVRMLRDLITQHLPSNGEVVEATPTGASKTIENMEEDLIRATLESVGGNRREAARKLGIGERTLYRKLKRYGEI